MWKKNRERETSFDIQITPLSAGNDVGITIHEKCVSVKGCCSPPSPASLELASRRINQWKRLHKTPWTRPEIHVKVFLLGSLWFSHDAKDGALTSLDIHECSFFLGHLLTPTLTGPSSCFTSSPSFKEIKISPASHLTIDPSDARSANVPLNYVLRIL